METQSSDFLEALSHHVQMKHPRSYQLSTLEHLRYEKFCFEHRDCGGPVSVKFTPTGIGDEVKVICEKCKLSTNITDVSSW